jgi:transposase InsO family protein
VIFSDKSSTPIRIKCRALGVSEQGYYSYCRRRGQRTNREKEDIELAVHIQKSFKASRRTYGTPRLKIDLAKKGLKVSRRRIGRLCKENGCVVKIKKKYQKTTDSSHSDPIAPNLLNREFEVSHPNKVWVSDVTYLRVQNHWLYLCTVIDLYSRKVIGRSLKPSMDESLILDALKMAYRNRQVKKGCIFHSDRGSQYASKNVRSWLKENGFVQSMSRKANCWDNSVAESSFSRLKSELGRHFDSDVEAMREVYEYLDVFHNHIRIHTTVGMTPVEFEKLNQKEKPF